MLHYAAKKNSKDILELLISKGADMNAKTRDITDDDKCWIVVHPGGKTPLHYAADYNSKEIGEILISKGADINAIDSIYLKIIILFLNNGI